MESPADVRQADYRARDIAEAALNLNSAERRGYLQRACGNDEDLRLEVENLLNIKPDGTATIASAVNEHVIGTVIGSYKLVRQIGEGGMGVVYHAHQLQPIRRDVALKIIKPGMDSGYSGFVVGNDGWLGTGEPEKPFLRRPTDGTPDGLGNSRLVLDSHQDWDGVAHRPRSTPTREHAGRAQLIANKDNWLRKKTSPAGQSDK
jgi:serine/threonine protein kinase